jgi:hypothetical protein
LRENLPRTGEIVPEIYRVISSTTSKNSNIAGTSLNASTGTGVALAKLSLFAQWVFRSLFSHAGPGLKTKTINVNQVWDDQ